MNTNQGIFESLPSQKSETKDSPFSMAGTAAVQSPFAVLEKPSSPFAVAADAADAKAKLPEKRKTDSPFHVAEPPEGFGFEASAPGANPFSTQLGAVTPPPLTSAQAEPAPSPFSVPLQFPSQATTPATPVTAAPAFTPSPQNASDSGGFLVESSSIRQLELRAIFGVDRELTATEIMQRAKALTGIRRLARLGAKEMSTIEGLNNLLPSLGLGTGPLRLYSGSAPIEFIREGAVVLAIQTDGSFAPGVRETLMIVARELGRLG